MPRFTSTGLAPAAMALKPDLTTACAITVAVVVPSPTMSLVLIAASLTSWAPMFSNWSFRWISRAIVTPSLVTTGDPVIFSRMTLRPLGPSVDFTASASWSTPASSRARASSPKRSSLAIGPPAMSGSTGSCQRSGNELGDEDGAAAYPAGVEIRQRIRRGIQRVGPGVQGNLARLGQHHQLGEVVVSADDVEHDLGAGPAGQFLHGGDLAAVGDHGVVRAELLGELERVRVAVNHDDLGGGERGEALDADVAEAAGPDDHGGGARVQQRDGLADRVVGGA